MNLSVKRTFLIAACTTLSLYGFSQKEDVPKGWHMLDKAKDGYNGISAAKAYEFVKTKKLKSNTVIVAVIQSPMVRMSSDMEAFIEAPIYA